jgi:hypothetical protein
MNKFAAEAMKHDFDMATKDDPTYPVVAHIEQHEDGSYSVVAHNQETGVTVRFETVEEFGSDEPSEKLRALYA